ncbi:hypothetical protein L6452_33389 [Arctium lappa]|uniref:Uncharacterized protein n=1 Tax=Arctium lappa TaxID=4217 RepID=A0ACB8YFV9_ARCLA|nr:hypothetical protein L6452_33389 [Arctium lappa]
MVVNGGDMVEEMVVRDLVGLVETEGWCANVKIRTWFQCKEENKGLFVTVRGSSSRSDLLGGGLGSSSRSDVVAPVVMVAPAVVVPVSGGDVGGGGGSSGDDDGGGSGGCGY